VVEHCFVPVPAELRQRVASLGLPLAAGGSPQLLKAMREPVQLRRRGRAAPHPAAACRSAPLSSRDGAQNSKRPAAAASSVSCHRSAQRRRQREQGLVQQEEEVQVAEPGEARRL
jgi:hypothetical protein